MNASFPDEQRGLATCYAFEFFDLPWLPRSIRRTLNELLAWYNGRVRGYYRQAARHVIETAFRRHSNEIVELGAGHGPLTDVLLSTPDAEPLRCVLADREPDRERFEELVARSPDRVSYVAEPVDLRRPGRWSEASLLVLCGVFHHIAPAERICVLRALSEASAAVLILEPVRKHWLSLIFCPLVVFGGLAFPVAAIRQPGRLRRCLWCWLLPIVPLMLLSDSIVSCLRQWSERQWQIVAEQLHGRTLHCASGVFDQRVTVTSP